MAAAAAAVAFGCVFGGELVAVPGLTDPVPAVRVFPAVVAAIGALVLLEPWRAFELAGARAPWRHRTFRFTSGLVVVTAAGGVLAANAEVGTILVLALLLYAALAVAVGLLGRLWWVLVVMALYAQLFVQSYEDFRPGAGWALAAVTVALGCYLARGEAVLGRSPYDGSPT